MRFHERLVDGTDADAVTYVDAGTGVCNVIVSDRLSTFRIDNLGKIDSGRIFCWHPSHSAEGECTKT